MRTDLMPEHLSKHSEHPSRLMCEDESSLSTLPNTAPVRRKNSPKVAYGKSREARAMSTKFLNSTATTLVPARGSSLEAIVNMSRAFNPNDWPYRVAVSVPDWSLAEQWCEANMGRFGRRWYKLGIDPMAWMIDGSHETVWYFRRHSDAVAFTLRWR
jgi:hypothetical protein